MNNEVAAFTPFNDLAYAGPRPSVTATIRSKPEDFQVDEILGFGPGGEGQHVLIQVRKRNTNTEWLARALAEFAGVPSSSVGYAGLKDRHALTTQWFSVDLAGRQEPDWSSLGLDDVEVLDAARHGRKLRRGALKGNHFKLILRDLIGDAGELKERVQRILAGGVPDYFGEQRFGRDSNNVGAAYDMFSKRKRVRDRHKRGLYLSTARALLFNRVLSQRVTLGVWDKALDGDVMMLEGSHSIFKPGTSDTDIEGRLAGHDIHPTGPLWGRGQLAVTGEAERVERDALQYCAVWRDGLELAGLKQERRALRINVHDLRYESEDGDSPSLQFTLPAGSFATVVLRELITTKARW